MFSVSLADESDSPSLLDESSDEKEIAFALGTARLLLQTLMACNTRTELYHRAMV